MRVWGSFYAQNLRYHLKHNKYFPIGTKFDESRLSQNLNGRFSLNFPDSYMAIRWIICASLGEFLCANFEISVCVPNGPPNLEIFSCVLNDISSLAHRNSPKFAQIIHLIAIQLSGKFKENLPFKF